jgi:hypothetical protein
MTDYSRFDRINYDDLVEDEDGAPTEASAGDSSTRRIQKQEVHDHLE